MWCTSAKQLNMRGVEIGRMNMVDGMILLRSSHDNQVMEKCKRAVLLYRGLLVFEGELKEGKHPCLGSGRNQSVFIFERFRTA